MRIPSTPAPLSAILDYLAEHPDRMDRVVGLGRATHQNKYLHWDKLRRQRPPEGMTHQEYWFALKFARANTRRALPLLDKADRPFTFCLPDVVLEHLHHIDQDAAGRIKASEAVLNSDSRDQYLLRSLVEEAITSSQIEGAATTRDVAKDMIRSGREPKDKGERMILNNYRAMQQIRRTSDHFFTPGRILRLHARLTQDTLEDASAAGRLRRPHERVNVVDLTSNEVLHAPPPAEQLPERLGALCDFANGKTPDAFVHPVVRAIVLHFWLAYDHPFVDGNGRCARALFYWSMLRQGYWLTEFLAISPLIRRAYALYERAFLYTETDENDLTYFLVYHLELVRQSVKELHAYLKRKMEAVREAERLLRDSAGFNARQLALLTHALRHGEARYTIRSHQRSHNVVYQTARTDLMDLERKGLLTRRVVGKTFTFSPVPDLARAMGKVR